MNPEVLGCGRKACSLLLSSGSTSSPIKEER